MGSVLTLARYLWEVYRELPGNWKQKKRIVTQMRGSIRDYVSEGANVSFEQLVNRFGEPKQIAATYVKEMEAGEVLEELKSNRKILFTVGAAMAAAVILWAGWIVASYMDHVKDMNGYAVVEIIEVERKQID